jgi:signal transduction histidine kinase
MVRARIAEDLHDEIASSLASVKLYSEVVQQQIPSPKKETKDLLQRIRQISGEVSEGIGQIIWSVDPRHDNLSDLLDYIERQSRPSFSAAKIDFQFKRPQQTGSIKLSPDQRRTIYLILKEAITNILRHSNCKFAELLFKHEGNSVEFVLKDDGSGFDIESVEKGHGLENMKKRAESIGAELSIASSPGEGTKLQLKAKIA